MPGIGLTNNTTLNIAASSTDGSATLNRYLTSPLSFFTPAGLNAIVGQTVGDLDPAAFPITASAAGEGKFAVEGTALEVQLGASASVGLLVAADASDFFTSVQWTQDPGVAGFVSFAFEGMLTAGDTATPGDLSFGIAKGATVTVTSLCTVAATERFTDTVGRAMAALTIPHDLEDLKSLPANTVCQIDASSSLQFSASVTYNFLNNPLATKSIPNLPTIAVNAAAAATIEGAATHTSDHTVTIAKLSSGLIHLSVDLTNTDDFETSLTVSAGVEAKVGNLDALGFLLARISPNSAAEFQKIQSDMPAAQAHQLSIDIKAAIDASLSNSLGASLKAALDDSRANSRVFLYEIDLAALDGTSTAALQSALTGDFTAMTASRKALAGIRELDSALTVTSTITHRLNVHLLGIFNWGSTNEFIKETKVDYTKDTHEIVLSDEAIEVVTNNLDAEKLREVVVKAITLTLPASAKTPAAPTPMNMIFFDRQAGASLSTMRQFVNVLQATAAAGASEANSLLSQKLKNYGTSSLYLGLSLTPVQCRQLFIDPAGKAYDWTTYLRYVCDAEALILSGDADNTDRLRLYTAGRQFWLDLREAGAAANQTRMLAGQNIRQSAIVDVTTVIWWSSAMENYATALAQGQSLVVAGKGVVKTGTLGFNEPWLVLATWKMLGNPAIDSQFTSSLLKQ